MLYLRTFLILFCGLALLFSCSKDKAIDPNSIITECDSTAVSYNRNIKQILDNNCALSGCHNSITKQSGFDYSNYTGAKQVYRALDNINHRNGALLMPTFGKMPDSLIVQIEDWVANNYCY